MATDATTQPAEKVPTSHPIGFWFFFWGEFAERASFYGMRAILALYLTERLGYSQDDGASFVSLFIAACYFAPIIGGLIADNYLGKYWTIVGFSGPYILGHVLVGIEEDWFVIAALGLLAMGSGVIKPNISALMGMTYDQQRPGQTQLRSDAFSWFYLAINIGAFLSQLAVPWIRTHYSYQMAFLFPAILMVVSFFVFAMGKKFYAVEIIERPERTPEEAAEDWRLKMLTLTRIGSLFFLIMFFWAIFDQSASTWVYFADTYMNLELDLIVYQTGFSGADAVQAVNAFFIMTLLPIFVFAFNRRAKAGKPVMATTKISIGFVLCGLSMVIMGGSGFLAGEKKEVYKITTDAGTFIVDKPTEYMVSAGSNSFNIDMTKTEADPDNKIKEKPALTLGDISLIISKMKTEDGKPVQSKLQLGETMLLMDDYEFDENKHKLTIKRGTITMSNGTTMALADGRVNFTDSNGLVSENSLTTPGVLESVYKPGTYAKDGKALKIDDSTGTYQLTEEDAPSYEDEEEQPKIIIEETSWVQPEERVTIWWQIFAYFVLTCSELLISITGLELAYVAAPDSMKSFVTAMWLATVGMANLVINVPFTQLYSKMPPGWYFMTMAIALGVVFVAFLPIATRFNRGMAEQAETEIQKGEADAK